MESGSAAEPGRQSAAAAPPPARAPRAASLYDAVIFDMDGVITDTAVVHAAAWKALFDEVLQNRSTPQHPFDEVLDYERFVDGRPREDGIRTFLASRGIHPGPDEIARLAARKQQLFEQKLGAIGAHVFADAVALLHRLRAAEIPTALVTSSRNADRVLQKAGIAELFAVRIDGNEAARLGLPGKPDPATFLEAARRLEVTPSLAVVVEDAEAGVRAAAQGGFGLVVALDRTGSDRLRIAGADLVLADLGGLDVSLGGETAARGQWAGGESGSDPWVLRYDGFDPATEGFREVLCALGNGYWGTRGAAPECGSDDVHYPGTYLAGVYNRVRTELDGHEVEDEHLVNAPNWLPLRFRIDGGDWLRPDRRVLDYAQELDLRRGVLSRSIRYREPTGRTTRITDRRFLSAAAPGIAVIESTVEAEDWVGTLTVQSALEGRVANRNVAEYWALADTHLAPRIERELDDETVLLETETNQSGIHIAMAARTRVRREPDAGGGDRPMPAERRLLSEPGMIGQEFELHLQPGHPVTIEKTVTVATSRDRAISSPALAVTTRIARAADAVTLLAEHERAWQILWDEFGVHLHTSGRQRLALNLDIFHVLQTVATVDSDLDAGVPARGLHGEAYRGHVFWDEVFVYPILTLRRPDLSRALLGYRYRRLDEAREAARAAGFEGAMFPWQSGIDGREETPTELFNPHSGTWMADNSARQRHVGIAVAYSVWQYYQSTGDVEFMIRQGAELLIEVARFFASIAEYDAASDRYDITGVMGPDEFHDGYPVPGAGVRNNAYTNVMTAWMLRRAVETVELIGTRHARPLLNRLRLRPDETERWTHLSTRLRVPFHSDGVISQFEGYENLAEFDWQRYRAKYRSLRRLDLILNAEGDSTNNYRISKQADVLMLLYLFSAEELRELLAEMGYPLPPEAVVATVEFYSARSTHGSTLSNVVHSWVEARRDRKRSWEFLGGALESDLLHADDSTTNEGVHLGAMAGAVDMVVRCYPGLEIRGDRLWLHPLIPPELGEVAFTITYRDQPVRIEVTPTTARLSLSAGVAAPITVVVDGQEDVLAPGVTREFRLSHAAAHPSSWGAVAPRSAYRTDMSNHNWDENVGDVTEAGVVDETAPEGERTEGSGRTDDPDERALLIEGSLSPGTTALGNPVDSDEHGAEHDRRWSTGPSQHNPNALIQGNRVTTAEDME